MDRKMWSVALLGMFVAGIAALPAVAQDTVYKETRQPSFSILVPDGWTIEKTTAGVTLHHGEATRVVLGIQQPVDPAAALESVRLQLEKQNTDFKVVDKGNTVFGNQPAVYMYYMGTTSTGVTQVGKVVIMRTSEYSWLLVELTPAENFNDEKATMKRIQESFTLASSNP